MVTYQRRGVASTSRLKRISQLNAVAPRYAATTAHSMFIMCESSATLRLACQRRSIPSVTIVRAAKRARSSFSRLCRFFDWPGVSFARFPMTRDVTEQIEHGSQAAGKNYQFDENS